MILVFSYTSLDFRKNSKPSLSPASHSQPFFPPVTVAIVSNSLKNHLFSYTPVYVQRRDKKGQHATSIKSEECCAHACCSTHIHIHAERPSSAHAKESREFTGSSDIGTRRARASRPTFSRKVVQPLRVCVLYACASRTRALSVESARHGRRGETTF